MADTDKNYTREQVMQLIKEKERLEGDIEALSEVLKSQGVGMDEPLTDQEDFPRSDIDVYQVRHARHDIRAKNNDLKKLLKEIEDGLHNLHKQAREGAGMEVDESQRPGKPESPVPFARVLVVCIGSPAEEAGIHQGDLIARFGSVTAENFESLKSISEVVEHSQNRALHVTLIRDGLTHRVQLTPKAWSGQGLLGFKIRPVSLEPER